MLKVSICELWSVSIFLWILEKLEEIEPSFNPVPEYEYEDEDDEEELVEAEDLPEEEIELIEVAKVDEEELEEVEEEVAEVSAGGDGTSPMDQAQDNADESYEIDVVNDNDQYQVTKTSLFRFFWMFDILTTGVLGITWSNPDGFWGKS